MNKVEVYIKEHWSDTIRYNPEDQEGLIGLPKSYTIPCISDRFQEMYYWDTYFTNVGLMLSGYVEQAKNNIDNIIYLIKKYGKMLNGNRVHYLNRSQPPFLSQMVREYYDLTREKIWLREEAYTALETEYMYWQSERITESDLNRYAGSAQEKETLREYGKMYCKRLGLEFPAEDDLLLQYGESMLAIAESGWDCSSRFEKTTHLYNPVDLNALLFLLESNMQYFSEELGYDDAAKIWNDRKEIRRRKMNALLWDNERKYYCDYHFVDCRKADMYSVATFYPLFAQMCSSEQAAGIVGHLPLLEMEYGVACCEKRSDLMDLQWDYPNGWACLQYIIVKGLLNYGYKKEAFRIVRKYIDIVDRMFEKTHNLWEKYNVVTGEVSITKEYHTPPMMGWTAGIYIYFKEILRKQNQ